MTIDHISTHSIQSSKGKHIMPRVSKNAFTRTTSEVVSASDSESSSNSSSQYGSGDEGAATPSGNTNSIGSAHAPESASYGLPGPVKAIVGTFCAATAVAGGIMLVYGGMALNNPLDSQADLHRALVGAGGAMLGAGSLVSMLCLIPSPDTDGQLPVVSA
jgi:hypothetical protein